MAASLGGNDSVFDRVDAVLFVGLVLAGALVLIPNLGDRCLWQDEAECALVAEGILRTGLPMAWDGRLLATQLRGIELTDSFLWAWTPWGMHYSAAAGMALFGHTPFGARMPFALLGSLSIGLTYLVARRLVRQRWPSLLAALLLMSSVQYLLLMRQSRYYAIIPVTALMAIWGYVDLSRRRGWVLLSGGTVLLFHANYASCACFVLGLLGHALLFRRNRQTFVRLALAGSVTALLTLPWFFGMGLHHLSSLSQSARLDHEPVTLGAIKMVFMMNQFVCPVAVVVGLLIGSAKGRLRVKGAYGLVTCMAVPLMVVLPLFLWANPRYMGYMIPLGAMAVAAAMGEIWLRNRIAGYLGALVAACSNLLPALFWGLFPASMRTDSLVQEYLPDPSAIQQSLVKKEWIGYLAELREPYVGPDEAITRFLNEHSSPNDIVFAPYGQLPIMVATGRRCSGLLDESAKHRPGWDRLPEYLWGDDAAVWLVVRPGLLWEDTYANVLRRWAERAAETGRHLKEHQLLVVDGWGNREVLRHHDFRSPGPGRAGTNIVLVSLRK
ncbi:MAG: glycosyltransferase family 39 protein [Phycisphaerae bacterium]|nr:glycosyltransferase family 39 protein [Phycisphaerae bacterium]